jgi:hypothetical protein
MTYKELADVLFTLTDVFIEDLGTVDDLGFY